MFPVKENVDQIPSHLRRYATKQVEAYAVEATRAPGEEDWLVITVVVKYY